MAVITTANGTVSVLQLAGRFDAHAAIEVGDWMKTKIVPPAKVVVDMSEVNFIDLSALSVLVHGLKRCRQQGGDLHLCNLQQPVRIIFELTRFNKTFPIYGDLAAATSAFYASQQ